VARRALVTGAGGFVAANLCRRLLADGHEVHALARPGSDLWRLAPIQSEVRLHEADLRDSGAVEAVLDEARPNWIFHLAAHGAYSWETDLETIFATNALGTARLVDAACRRKFSAFVHAGSSSEYGYKDHAPDEREWIEPNSAYAVSKAAATLYGRSVALERDVHIVTLRLYSAYGPWEEPRRLMPTLALHGLEGRLPPLVDPRTARDFVHVDDVCDAFVLAASSSLERGAVLNLGTGHQVSLGELVELVRSELGIAEEPHWSSMEQRRWDTSVWVADASRIRAELGWEPRTELADGFRSLVEWLSQDDVLRRRYARQIAVP
jgi:UDP-glucose 4-epimerase